MTITRSPMQGSMGWVSRAGKRRAVHLPFPGRQCIDRAAAGARADSAAMPGSSMEDVVIARAVYSKLDAEDSPVRVRLNSTVVQVRNVSGQGASRRCDVAYMRGGKLHTVTGKNCVLACYNGMIPYICPDVPAEQSKALSYLVKMPLVYTHVALRNWEPFAKLNVHHIVAPGGYHTYTALDFPVSLGAYKFPASPKEPAVLFMLRTPCKPGLDQREQNRAGRRELLDTPFATFEKNIRDQLNRMLGPAGFDAARDIEGITVNRWAHGYAFTPNPLFDPDWKEEEKPWVIGRRRVGRIAIANSDAGASAYTERGHRSSMARGRGFARSVARALKLGGRAPGLSRRAQMSIRFFAANYDIVCA